MDQSFSIAATTEATLPFQVATPQAHLSPARADLRIVPGSAASSNFKLGTLRVDNERLESLATELSSMVHDMCFQLVTAQVPISPAAIESLRYENDRNLCFFCLLDVQFD